MLAYSRRLRASARARGDEGVSTVEYGLLVAAITAVVILVLFAVATLVKQGFDDDCGSSGVHRASTSSTCPS